MQTSNSKNDKNNNNNAPFLSRNQMQPSNSKNDKNNNNSNNLSVSLGLSGLCGKLSSVADSNMFLERQG